MKSAVACDTCGEDLDTVPGLGLVCANGCSFDYTKPRQRGREVASAVDAVRSCAQCDARLGRLNSDTLCAICRDAKPLKMLPPVTQRVCSTPGCGRVLSQGTVGDLCRAHYQSLSVSGQERAKAGIVEPEVVPARSLCLAPRCQRFQLPDSEDGLCVQHQMEARAAAAATRGDRVQPAQERPVRAGPGRPPGSPVDPILVEYLSAGPRSKQDIAKEVERHGLSIHQVENARQRLGIQSYYDKEKRMSLWSLDEHDSNENQPVMTAQRDREKVTVERERVTITAAEGSIKTVALKGGGQITVNIVADFFRLTAGDRGLVLGLVDALNAFEQGEPPPNFHHCACEHYKAAGDAAGDVSKDGLCLVCGACLDSDPHKPGCAQAVLEVAGVGS